MTTGVILINLGTPDSPNVSDVRSYLREFLSDSRVIDIPYLARWLLVNVCILPFRPKQSASAYKKIWTQSGSPLLLHCQELTNQLQQQLGGDYCVTLAMRYGKPSIKHALSQLSHCHRHIVLPLFPQYSSAATGSAIEAYLQTIKQDITIPSIRLINHFHDQPHFIQALCQQIKTHHDEDEFLLFSYHGIPERQALKSGCQSVCKQDCPTSSNLNCYRAQCYQTTRLVTAALKLAPTQYTTSFQSRLGKTPWIKPYSDEVLNELAKQGIKKIAVICPSFVADCLETLEEIGIVAKKQWQTLGGESFKLIPCLNANPHWVDALANIVMNR